LQPLFDAADFVADRPETESHIASRIISAERA
jgi:hypothetical protein